MVGKVEIRVLDQVLDQIEGYSAGIVQDLGMFKLNVEPIFKILDQIQMETGFRGTSEVMTEVVIEEISGEMIEIGHKETGDKIHLRVKVTGPRETSSSIV